jgi:GNAT superfamily N-acetyltransferase
VPLSIEVTAEPEQMPAPADVETLLALASSRLGPSDAASLAQASARMYSWARSIPGAATAAAHDGATLVGFGYGYSWDWSAMTDAWSLRLADQLGPAAAALDHSFSIVLLVVAPAARRRQLGARLLAALHQQADEPVTWLQTAADSPTRALCAAAGWRALDEHADPVIMLTT